MNIASIDIDALHEALGQGALVLTVNQRLARRLLSLHGDWREAAGQRSWESVGVLPYTAWLRRWYEDRQLLDELERAAGHAARPALLPELLERKLWQDVVDADDRLQLLDTRAAADLAREALVLSRRWRVENDADRYLSDDQFAWERWKRNVFAQLESQGWIESSRLPALVIEAIAAAGAAASQVLSAECVVFAGFVELTPEQRALIAAMQAAGIDVKVLQNRASASHVRRVPCQDDHHELAVLAEALRGALDEAARRGTSIRLGVVVGDLGQRRVPLQRALEAVFFPGCLPSDIEAIGRPWDFSIGSPLGEEPLVQAAMWILELVLSGLSPTHLASLLGSPAFCAEGASRSLDALQRKVRGMVQSRVSLAELRERTNDGSDPGDRLDRLLQERRLSATGSAEWAERFDRWLDIVGWPGRDIGSREYQSLEAWHGCLDDLHVLDDKPLSAHGILQALKRLLGERAFQPERSRQPIEIMGRLESHGLDFDHLWVLGMDSEQWPPSAVANPFLSIAAQKAQGVPEASASARLERAEAEIALWLDNAAELTFMHALMRDGNAILPAAAVEPYPEIVPGVLPDTLAATLAAGLATEAIADTHGSALAAGSALRHGASVFDHQSACPFRGFALHRLGASEVDDHEIGLDARRLGDLVHGVLERFWRETRNRQALLAMSTEERRDRLAVAADEALASLAVGGTLAELEKRRLVLVVDGWLEHCELPRSDFEVLAIEQERDCEVAGLRLKLRIDRVDEVDGQNLLIDYKTGMGNRPKDWLEARLRSPQLPLYASVSDDVRGIAFGEVTASDPAFKGMLAESGLLPGVRAQFGDFENWAELRQHWQAALAELGAELRAGLATVTPAARACNYCELKPLCRIDAAGADEDAADMSDDDGEQQPGRTEA